MKKSKIILQIRNASSFDFGGAERFPIFLANSLEKYGYQSVIVSRSKALLKFAEENKIKTIKGLWWSRQNWSGINLLLFPVYILWQIVIYLWYLYIFIKTKPDAVHIQSKDDFIAGTLAAKTLRLRVVWSDHADLKHVFKNIYVPYKNPIGKLVYMCGLLSNGILVSSNNEMKLILRNLRSKSLLNKKFIIVYNGVQDSKENYTFTKNEKFTFGVATRLVTDKGISEAIGAFKKLKNKHPQIRLLIVGDGPESNKFKLEAKDEKQIVFTGYLSNPLEIMSSLDVLLHPTYHESFSITILEGSMLGLPIIATDVGGNPEIIKNHETGILVKSKDTESLYEAMGLLYENKKLRDELGKNARTQFVKKFNFDNIVNEEYLKLYEK